MDTPDRPIPWTALLVGLILAAAALFVVGTTAERHSTATETTQTSTSETSSEQSSEGHTEGGGEKASPNSAETVFGINAESNGAIVAAAVLSVALALAAWLRPRRPVFLVGAAFCLAAAVFDLREMSHQFSESRNGLATVALFVALLHLAAVAAGVLATRPPNRLPAN
jgi:hypothetical protein